MPHPSSEASELLYLPGAVRQRLVDRLVDGQVQLLHEWRCPLTQACMRDPVVLSSGFSYEREAITAWLKDHDTDPATGSVLKNQDMTPNHTLKSSIQQWSADGLCGGLVDMRDVVVTAAAEALSNAQVEEHKANMEYCQLEAELAEQQQRVHQAAVKVERTSQASAKAAVALMEATWLPPPRPQQVAPDAPLVEPQVEAEGEWCSLKRADSDTDSLPELCSLDTPQELFYEPLPPRRSALLRMYRLKVDVAPVRTSIGGGNDGSSSSSSSSSSDSSSDGSSDDSSDGSSDSDTEVVVGDDGGRDGVFSRATAAAATDHKERAGPDNGPSLLLPLEEREEEPGWCPLERAHSYPDSLPGLVSLKDSQLSYEAPAPHLQAPVQTPYMHIGQVRIGGRRSSGCSWRERIIETDRGADDLDAIVRRSLYGAGSAYGAGGMYGESYGAGSMYDGCNGASSGSCDVGGGGSVDGSGSNGGSEDAVLLPIPAMAVPDELQVDEAGVDAENIELVMTQAKVSRAKAVQALRTADGDVVAAVLEFPF